MATVLITGSSRGIGLSIANAFAKAGHDIILNGREDLNALDTALAEIKKNYEVTVTAHLADVSSYEATKKMFENFAAPPDIIINNAGAEYFGLFAHMTPEEIGAVVNNNLQTVLNVSHLGVPYMVRQKAGAIINISSIWGVAGASCEAVYSAAKAGVNGFTQALAKELAPSNVRVNAIACGAFETRMNARLTPEEKQDFTQAIPLGRFGQPQEVGELAVFLASPKAEYLTGQIINLDGGLL